MSKPEASADNLPEWLDYIGSVHLKEIELGLDRVRAVAQRLGCMQPAATVVTVAGTNGKGSVVACVEALLTAAGYRTGSYTSPHLDRFNERIRFNQVPASDDQITAALAAVNNARGDISLSYFEFSTLAALLLFKQKGIDFAILEVGLGGRLDAVNLVDPDLSVITCIDLDHQEWLGKDRETIAMEKAGILRPATPFICADPQPPQGLLAQARKLDCPGYLFSRDYSIESSGDSWRWRGVDSEGQAGELTWQAQLSLLPINVACALQVVSLLPVSIDDSLKTDTVASLSLAGRQEWCRDASSGKRVLLDVGHNPAAMASLANSLGKWRTNQCSDARVIAVMAVMADKDIQDMARNLESSTDIWYIAELAVPRALGLDEFAESLRKGGFKRPFHGFRCVEEAYKAACDQAGEQDLVVVSGSFHTIAKIRPLTTLLPGAQTEVAAQPGWARVESGEQLNCNKAPNNAS